MQKDNTMGAPTEGLGQAVTFAFDPQRAAPQLQISTSGEASFGVKGGGPASPGGIGYQKVERGAEDPTMALLMSVGDSILKKRVAEARTAAYVTGMQRAMAGEAVADMAKNQPWYTKIFGDSDVVEGARAYAGHTVAQTTVASMQEQMPELRKMSPQQAQAFFTSSVQKNLTGDAATDASIMQAMTSALPSVMARQTKEHYGWQQENATKQEATAYQAGVVNLSAAGEGYASGKVTDEEMAGAKQRFVRSLLPAEGRDEQSRQNSITNLMVNSAINGDFHALNAMTDKGPDGSGVSLFDTLGADKQNVILRAREAGENKMRVKHAFDTVPVMAQLEIDSASGTVSTNDLLARAQAVNEAAYKRTGSHTPPISPDYMRALATRNQVHIEQEKSRSVGVQWRQAEAQAVAGAKEDAEKQKNLVYDQAIMGNTMVQLAATPGVNRQELDARAANAYFRAPPGVGNKILINNSGHVVTPVVHQIEQQVSSALRDPDGGDFQNVVANYVKFRNESQDTAQTYYGKFASRLDEYVNMVGNGASPKGAFSSVFVSPKFNRALPKEDMKAAVAAVGSEVNDWTSGILGGMQLKDHQARRAVGMISGAIDQHNTSGDVVEATRRGVRQAMTTGTPEGVLEIAGGYVWQRGRKNQTSLKTYLTGHAGPKDERPVGQNGYHAAVDGAMNELLFGKGGKEGLAAEKPSDVYIAQLADKNGEPVFHVQAIVDHVPINATLRGSQIFEFAERDRKRKEALLAPTSTGKPLLERLLPTTLSPEFQGETWRNLKNLPETRR